VGSGSAGDIPKAVELSAMASSSVLLIMCALFHLVTPDHVVEAVMRYYEDGVLS
jgi:hypothetical protein